MLCPEVVTFPPPKTICFSKSNETLESVLKTTNMNSFYKSLVITCPDEIQTPKHIDELITEDSEYYNISACSLTEFIEPNFVENFVKKGKLYCLTVNKNCIVDNCACITPDGILTVHVLDFVYQTLGIDGTKRPHNYYEVKIDLNNIKSFNKIKQGLSKLESFNFDIIWEPHEENICPSSIAKYFYDRNVKVSSHNLSLKYVTPEITEVPSIKDTDADEMVEWMGMLAIGGDINPTEGYISTYCAPESEYSLKTSRMSILIVKGFIPASLVCRTCESVLDYASSRDLDHYWAAVSVQSQEDCLWQWGPSSPKMFQAHDNSYNVFFSKANMMSYSIGQLKYS